MKPKKYRADKPSAVYLFTLLFALSFTLEAQDRGLNFLPLGDSNISDTVNAQNEFRIGVQAYYRFAYNEAINSFERANSFRHGEPLILDWLGKSYYRSGFEDTAIRQWNNAADFTSSSSEEILLRSRIETVRRRRNFIPFMEEGPRYVESGRYPGRIGGSIYFRQPTSVLPLEDGTAWVVAYGSNELVRIDVNGLIRDRIRGPLNGFDRPYDVARSPDGKLYVSEYRGGRVSVLDAGGRWLSYIGARGIDEGQFVGPQNLTVDEDGYLYVVDYGNRRVAKFDPEGTFLFSFGRRTWGFSGFTSPTGIACLDERVFVADGVTKQIHAFDRNGSYLGVVVEEGLNGPESLRIIKGQGGQNHLLVADTNRVLLIDPDSSILRELALAGSKSRITGAGLDRNGAILAANFMGDEVAVMCSADDLASGFFVQIDRVVADTFPLVTIELTVQDSSRRPVVGLDQHNFLITEQNRPVQQQEYLGAAYLGKNYDISVVLEKSDRTMYTVEELTAALRDISSASPGIVSIISAGETPIKENISASNVALAARSANFSPRWRFDTAIRLAASDLLAREKKRAVVFVTSGVVGELAFEQYSLSELAAYLANNGTAFFAVITDEQASAVTEELRYLCDETGGEIMYLYQSSGVGPSIKSIGAKGSGSYALRYKSSLPTNFGRNLLTVESEVYLMERSGRDRIGYFAPLE
jgi:DNA-binding beta-propeller fold protein YncE